MFLNYGFKSVTMDDIARDMGVSKKTLYGHFKNKNKLVETVAMNLFTSICHGIDKICAISQDPISELYELKKYVMEHLKGEKTHPIHQLYRYYPEVHAKLRGAQFEYMSNCMLDNITRGITEGLFRENLNPDFVFRIYFIGMEGIKDLEIFKDTDFTSAELHEQYLEYHLRGIVTPKGRKILNRIINADYD